MKLTDDEWFGRGERLLPPEEEAQPGRWTCKRCGGNCEVGCTHGCNGGIVCVGESGKPPELCDRCEGDGVVTCASCDGRGYHRSQDEARKA